MDVVLGLASGANAKIRGLALRYYLDNATTKYSSYSPMTYSHMAFVPAIKDKQSYMAKPTEVSILLRTPYFLAERKIAGVFQSDVGRTWFPSCSIHFDQGRFG